MLDVGEEGNRFHRGGHMTRRIEVDWRQEHTSIIDVGDDGSLELVTSSTGGPEFQLIRDPDRDSETPEVDHGKLLDLIAGIAGD
jgi:hypothetical protein